MRLRRHRYIEPPIGTRYLSEGIAQSARPLHKPADFDPLIKQIGDACFVLIGEASHGTSEYYRWRAQLTSRLIREKGFSFVAVEGDWPDCYRIDRYVKGHERDCATTSEVLDIFVRWPTWMWANQEVSQFVEWLRDFNKSLPETRKVGFFGLDVYSLWDSLYAVLGYLRNADPELLRKAHRALTCFQPYGEDVQEYARATALVPTSCEDEVIDLLKHLRSSRQRYLLDGPDTFFLAEQNATVVKNAEAYYRAMVRGGPESWNIRDRHMFETLERLMRHHGTQAKAIVWEHNTHVGDARYTDMIDDGMVNVGQLVRQRHAHEGVYIVGFASHHGTVIAARDWEAPVQILKVPPARPRSWEDVLHCAGTNNKLLLLDKLRDSPEFLTARGHRAIGVVYHPELEQQGNYVPTILPRRYDALCYFDETHALHPLRSHPAMEMVPETYPFGV